MNCDGVVNFGDIDALVLAINNPEGYALQYPDCLIELGDANDDGSIDFDDIDAFIALMGGDAMNSRRYIYDEENRLTAVTDANDVLLLWIRYDAIGRRIESWDYADDREPCGAGAEVKTRHVYSGIETIEEYVCCQTTPTAGSWTLAREFIWGERFPEPLVLIDHTDLGDKTAAAGPEVLRYVRDALGSVVGLTDAGDPTATPDPIPPTLVERYDYDPYGRTYIENGDGSQRFASSRYGNPFAWTSQRYDAGVELYHFRHRTYSPHLGRWLQRDPLGFVNGVNLYEYVASMPTFFMDPLGLLSVAPEGMDPCKLIKGSVGEDDHIDAGLHVLKLQQLAESLGMPMAQLGDIWGLLQLCWDDDECWWDEYQLFLERFLAEYAAYLAALAEADPATSSMSPFSDGPTPWPGPDWPDSPDSPEAEPESDTRGDATPLPPKAPSDSKSPPRRRIKPGKRIEYGAHIIHGAAAGAPFAIVGAAVSDVVCTVFCVWAMPGSTYRPGDCCRNLYGACKRVSDGFYEPVPESESEP
jgi:RHS repeat-associated protein